MGFILFIVSVVLSLVIYPLAFLTSIITGFRKVSFKVGLKKLNRQFMDIAVSIDATGNVVCDDLLNVIWISSKGYRFGNRKETVSSVLGKNQQAKTLTWLGRLIAWILDTIDKNHCLKSIDNAI